MDKLPLKDFVVSVADQFLQAVEEIESKHGEWRVGSLELVAKIALKPVDDHGKLTVYADVDEPARMQHEITIPLTRKTL